MSDAIIGLVCQFVLALILGATLLAVSFIVGRKRDKCNESDGVKLSRVEKRIRALSSQRVLMAILFLPLVVCAALLFPWAVALGKAANGGNWLWIGSWGLVLVLFALISTLYMWGRGALGGR
jgi:NADH:ubiquinone oxidoreductase subunit 3 (subunit A)